MKVVIVNKFLYRRGGDCICALNLGDLLREHGDEVRYFGMSYPENLPFSEECYFPEEVSFGDGSLGGRLKAASRLLFGSGVERGFVKLLDDFCPDVVHLHNIHSYLSPIVARLAAERGVRVVWTLHDYKLLCPSYACLSGGEMCERCYGGALRKWNVVSRRCMKGSTVAALMAWMEALRWNRENLTKWTSTFICPSNFMRSRMVRGGFPEEKLRVVSNFISDSRRQLIEDSCESEREEAYCYVGRLSVEKGVEQLMTVASRLPYRLYVAGDGPLAASLRCRFVSENIVFTGQLTEREVTELLRRVRFSVVPSVCYENNPLSVIESLCCGTPVVGSRVAGIPELIGDGCGMLYQHDDPKALESAIRTMFATPTAGRELSERSLLRFGREEHYRHLIEIYRGRM